MYSFVDTNQKTTVKRVLSAESLFINGSALEQELPELKILTTTGRELNAVNLSTKSVDKLDGVLFLNSNEDSRIISVNCLIEAKTNHDFRLCFEQLNRLLRQGLLCLSFNDDKEYYYEAYFQSSSGVTEGTNNSSFTLEFFCPKPFKYSIRTVKENQKIMNNFYFQTVPESLFIDVTKKMDDVTVTNNRTGNFIKLILNKQFEGKIIVKPQQNTAFIGILEKPQLVSWNSDCEYFDVQKGDVLSVTPETSIEIEVREKLL
ncbi:distal tail protein Dit [Vagococcus silagei]|uniref:Siphovirus-type tail component RIFT-related domain-containing protein n=1 Tax=Vagococcus silagei TaxID=2508885 RepID=A0A4S3B4V1_9ENTE|nr:distal tail protein Dit [Vagococcus silagei]THB62174.1 hypothetical protein ESZ54_01135 [Vagococcus silagei]